MLESGMAFVVFKAVLGFGLPLAFAVHQLWSLRRDEWAQRQGAEIVPMAAPDRPVGRADAPERRAA